MQIFYITFLYLQSIGSWKKVLHKIRSNLLRLHSRNFKKNFLKIWIKFSVKNFFRYLYNDLEIIWKFPLCFFSISLNFLFYITLILLTFYKLFRLLLLYIFKIFIKIFQNNFKYCFEIFFKVSVYFLQKMFSEFL